ncbi:DUF6544 family protein [Mucilaginibacter sp.]|uniref:DUF6920 family protein n=1 Tax=Mucilaginibacter sp. TaxID=1882438 RepID=UPI0025F0BE4A|nr:DUF6544 family protein [Mucilaginibacter sp.]
MFGFNAFTSLKKIFATEVKAETDQYYLSGVSRPLRDITDLPEVLQQCLSASGYTGKENLICCSVSWKEAFLKTANQQNWAPLVCKQVNFLPVPARIVYMRSKLMGVVPFGARDKYQNGKGSMLIKLMNIFTLSDTKGKEMDVAELVTILAETMLIPAYALQPYISWRELDHYTLEGIIHDRGVSASGIFYFNKHNEFLRFETSDRYYTDHGTFKKYKWIAYAGGYMERNGIRFPSEFRAVWKMPHEDYCYFKGKIDRLENNIFDRAVSNTIDGSS